MHQRTIPKMPSSEIELHTNHSYKSFELNNKKSLNVWTVSFSLLVTANLIRTCSCEQSLSSAGCRQTWSKARIKTRTNQYYDANLTHVINCIWIPQGERLLHCQSFKLATTGKRKRKSSDNPVKLIPSLLGLIKQNSQQRDVTHYLLLSQFLPLICSPLHCWPGDSLVVSPWTSWLPWFSLSPGKKVKKIL